jgi:hypothetical protein
MPNKKDPIAEALANMPYSAVPGYSDRTVWPSGPDAGARIVGEIRAATPLTMPQPMPEPDMPAIPDILEEDPALLAGPAPEFGAIPDPQVFDYLPSPQEQEGYLQPPDPKEWTILKAMRGSAADIIRGYGNTPLDLYRDRMDAEARGLSYDPSQAQAWNKGVGWLAGLVDPGEVNPPEGAMMKAADYVARAVPGAAKAAGEYGLLNAIVPGAGVARGLFALKDAFSGNQAAQSEIFNRLTGKGIGEEEAYRQATDFGPNAADFAARGASSALMMNLLGRSPASYLGRAGDVAGAAGVSALSAGGTSALADVRAGEDADWGKAGTNALESGLVTGLWGLYDTARNFSALKYNDAVTRQGFTPVGEKFDMESSFLQIANRLFNRQISFEDARAMLVKAGLGDIGAETFLQNVAGKMAVGAPRLPDGSINVTPEQPKAQGLPGGTQPPQPSGTPLLSVPGRTASSPSGGLFGNLSALGAPGRSPARGGRAIPMPGQIEQGPAVESPGPLIAPQEGPQNVEEVSQQVEAPNVPSGGVLEGFGPLRSLPAHNIGILKSAEGKDPGNWSGDECHRTVIMS